jgi:predicted nuclease of predicted toxin-antitoxin system
MAEYLSGDKRYNFLLDRNVEHLALYFPKQRVKTASQEGLPPSASDTAVVEKAWLRQSVIVTADIKDFRPAIVKFQRQKGRNPCGCLFGLIGLPNVHETQKRLLKNRLSDLESQLPRVGAKRITWKDIHQRNYMVRVMKAGSPQVTELGLCPDCTP